MKFPRFLVLGFVPAILANCASVVSDDDTMTSIETVPKVASCELNGNDFVQVVDTPTSLELPAKAAPITLTCSADGYLPTTEDMDTAADGWILGNILLGGVVGIAIDAARGAGQKYPPRVTVVLEPSEFEDLAARDAWYDNRRDMLMKKWDTAMLTVRDECNRVEGGKDCPAEMEKAEAARQVELDKLEARRNNAQVRLQ